MSTSFERQRQHQRQLHRRLVPHSNFPPSHHFSWQPCSRSTRHCCKLDYHATRYLSRARRQGLPEATSPIVLFKSARLIMYMYAVKQTHCTNKVHKQIARTHYSRQRLAWVDLCCTRARRPPQSSRPHVLWPTLFFLRVLPSPRRGTHPLSPSIVRYPLFGRL